ncbi:hypothetical protein FITA111629_03805 [Filibacter tadaridae]|uniref:Lipoprotein n=1 Tax=Filibacter tadaridae TaxID=2483811 RepID=A0A3P5XU81_9BACL|nr:hypothetical protein [Filibacter tadaridae]VDC32695.1 hypothetical protein FILTAD_02869 [Filibacter tadaridae]
MNKKTGRNRFHLWKLGIALLFSLCCLAITGCSQTEPQDKNKEGIQSVLEFEFNAPNGEALSAYNKWIDSEQGEHETYADYNDYLETTFEPYFTENGFERYVRMGSSLQFHLAADKNDYQLKVNKIEVEQNKKTPTIYDFVVYMDYVQQDGETKKIEIPGIAVLREGKIEKITYMGDRKLRIELSHGK